MKGKQHLAGEMVRPVKLESYSSPASKDYLDIPVKRDVVEALGWLPEEEPVYIQIKPELEEADGEVFVVLEMVLGEESERDSYKLKQSNGFSVTLPATWEAHQEDYKGHTNPFYGLGTRDQVILVGSPEEQKIRLYHPRDYRKKTGLDIRAPALAFFTNSLFNRFADLARQTPYSGQKWEIVPFDAQHDVFEEEATSRNYQSFLGFRGDQSLFERVYEKGSIPVVRARKIRIRWNPYYEHPVNEFSGEPSMETPIKEEIEAGAFVVYQDYLTRSSQVILPEKGAYIIEAEMKEGYGWVAAAYFDESTGWDAKYWIEEGDHHRMYVPTPTKFEEGKEPENAKDWKNGASGP